MGIGREGGGLIERGDPNTTSAAVPRGSSELEKHIIRVLEFGSHTRNLTRRIHEIADRIAGPENKDDEESQGIEKRGTPNNLCDKLKEGIRVFDVAHSELQKAIDRLGPMI